MSKKMKILIAAVAAILVLSVVGTTMVMAQEEEPAPAPETGANGLLPRVADILGISQEELVNAFHQAQQEMREDAFIKFVEKAVEKGIITQPEADEILQWWENRPEAADKLIPPARIFRAVRARHMQQGILPMKGGPATPPWLGE